MEAAHGIIEPEFYELERFNGSVQAFLRQAYGYQLYFNLLRRNSAKGNRTPEQLRQARAPTVSPQIYFLPPVMLSSLQAQDLLLPPEVLEGHDVPGDLTMQPDPPSNPTAVNSGRRSGESSTAQDPVQCAFPQNG